MCYKSYIVAHTNNKSHFQSLKAEAFLFFFLYRTGKCTTRIGLKIANSREQNQDIQFVSLL